MGQRLGAVVQRRNEVAARARENVVREALRRTALNNRSNRIGGRRSEGTDRCLRLKEGIRARVERSIARIELKLSEEKRGEEGEEERGTYTGPERLFELALALIWALLLFGGCALAMITRPVGGFPFDSDAD